MSRRSSRKRRRSRPTLFGRLAGRRVMAAIVVGVCLILARPRDERDPSPTSVAPGLVHRDRKGGSRRR